MAKVLFIENPIAGLRKKDIRKAITACRHDYEVVKTQYAGHATEIAASTEADIVVAVGGDGTVNEVASGLIGTDKIFGIVPCGSGNGLARHLKISMNPFEAIEVINRGSVASIDSGVVNGVPFFCTCGVGLDAQVSENFTLSGKRGVQTYAAETFKLLTEYTPASYEVSIDGNLISQKAVLVTVANANQWGNNGFIAPDASLSDGLLNVTIVAPFPSIRIPGMVVGLFTKQINKMHGVYSYLGRDIKIIPEKKCVAHRDGEPILDISALEVTVRPSSLKVIIP